MFGPNQKDSISVVLFLFFISKSFVLISAQFTHINFNQQCSKMFLCHPRNPKLFLQCVPNVGIVKMTCQNDLFFNSVINACDWPQNSDCVLNVTMKTSPNSVGAATGPTVTSRESYKIKKSKIIDRDNKEKKHSSTTASPTRRWENVKKGKLFFFYLFISKIYTK